MEQYVEKWWVILLQGLFLLTFGFFALFWPGITLKLLIVAFALYIVADGILNIVDGFMSRKVSNVWFMIIVLGILEIFAGVFALRYPELTAQLFGILIGATFLIKGVFEIIFAFSKDNEHRFLGFILGALGMLAGAIVLMSPLTASVAYVWVLGAFALVAGPLTIATSFALRSQMPKA